MIFAVLTGEVVQLSVAAEPGSSRTERRQHRAAQHCSPPNFRGYVMLCAQCGSDCVICFEIERLKFYRELVRMNPLSTLAHGPQVYVSMFIFSPRDNLGGSLG